MTLATAIQLIADAPVDRNKISQWADLGAGSGLFTQALSSLLVPVSKVYAIDQSKQNIKVIRDDVKIEFRQADFIADDLDLPLLDGVVMANSLHYVRNKSVLIQRLKKFLSPRAGFIIVEYDLEKANRWVPYPIRPAELEQLFFLEGYDQFQITGQTPSTYNGGMIYAAYISKESYGE